MEMRAQRSVVKPFSSAKKWLTDLDSETASRLITVASDVALVVSDAQHGVIRDVSFGNDELAGELTEKWVGKPWAETVTADSRQKIEALLRDSSAKGMPRWRMVNHRSATGANLPVLYAAIQVNAGQVVAFGRSMQPMAALQQQLMSAQQSMEREYLKLRQTEARHRLLFQVSSEAVLIVDAATRKIVEANPAAGKLLGGGSKRLVGRLFPEGFDEPSSQALQGLMGAVRATGRTDDVTVRSVDGAREFVTSASLFREEKASFFLIRLTDLNAGRIATTTPTQHSKVLEIVASAPEGFVVTDLDGRILYCNRAFLDLAQLATEEQSRNESLDRWLGRPGVDFNLLTAQLREHGSLRMFATQLRGEYGSTSDVEIYAVSVVDGEEPCFGFTIRDVGQRVTFDRQVSREKPRSVAQLTELVGRVPLKDLVRESTDMIEKLCIEAALEITGDNRASAAEILGLSRQSLYAKLRRYGLGELASAESEHSE
jgi:transcriptional regulator PpsR